MGRAHVPHLVPDAPLSGVRPKPISRTVIADRLALALQATETPKAALAARWGVDAVIVRRVCAGERPLTVERLVEAGRVGAAVLRLAAEEAHPVARRGASPERHVLAVARHAGAVAAEVEAATADGVVDAAERARILGRALELRDAADALIADLGVG